MSLLENYEKNVEELSKTEKYCLEKLFKKEFIDSSITIQQLADEFSVSTTTIFRMVKKLDYSSFNDFKYDLLYDKRASIKEHQNADNNKIIYRMKEQLNTTLQYLENIDFESINNSIKNAKNVLVCGTGMSNYIGRILEIKLNLNNINTKYADDKWFMFLEASNLKKHDVVIVLSKTGETTVLIDAVKSAKLNGAIIVLISEIGDSPLAALADYKIYVSQVENDGLDIDTRLQIHVAINYLTKILLE